MNTNATADPIVVGINLDGTIAAALDAACGATLSSRAGFVRRALVSALRDEGYMPQPDTGPRPVARTRPGVDR